MSAKELGDIQVAHDLAIAYATHVTSFKKEPLYMDDFFKEYDDAYEHFIILICRQE